ncbi:MAG: hypothetical protein SP1CHLAM9_12080 [Chlamydiia bacterium]|nr:hypothetical protein [Chlamydiia bacterium]
MVGTHPHAKPHPQNPFFTRGQTGQHPRCRFLQISLNSRVQRQNSILILQKITQLRIVFIPHGGFQRYWLFGDFHHFAHLIHGHLQLIRQFLWRRLASDFVQNLATCPREFINRFNHMHGDANSASLVGNAARYRLTHPPCRVGRKFIAPAVLKFIHRPHQPDITLLYQIQELQPAIIVFFRNGNDEAQISLYHLLLRYIGFLFALLHLINNLAIFGDIHADILPYGRDFLTQIGDSIGVFFGKSAPPASGFLLHGFHPFRV